MTIKVVAFIAAIPVIWGLCSPLDGDWIGNVDTFLQQGDIAGAESVLETVSPQADSEKAAFNYYKARLSLQRQEMAAFLKKAAEYPQTSYGQQALLELAKIALLERDYPITQDYLQRITPAAPTAKWIIEEKEFLMAAVYLKMDNYEKAITAAENFIEISDDHRQKEIAYLTIAEAHILNRQYETAIGILTEMEDQILIKDKGCVVSFKKGYCYEMLEKFPKAVTKYRHTVTRHPYTDSSYQAQKRLYDLTVADRISHAELGFSSPSAARDGQISDIPFVHTTDRNGEEDFFYVQVNAFSEIENAQNHSSDLKTSGFENIVFPKTVLDKELYVVAVGPFEKRKDAAASQRVLKEQKDLDSFIIKLRK